MNNIDIIRNDISNIESEAKDLYSKVNTRKNKVFHLLPVETENEETYEGLTLDFLAGLTKSIIKNLDRMQKELNDFENMARVQGWE